MDTIEQIKSNLSIADLLNRLSLEINASGCIYSIYKEEKTPSLHIYFDTNSFYDFSTKTGGDVIQFYADYHKIDTKTAVKELADMLNIKKHREPTRQVKPKLTIELLKDSAGKVFEEEQYYFDERTGVYEFEAELSKEESERLAYQDLLFYRQDIRSNLLEKFYEYGYKNMPADVENYLLNERGLTVNTILDFKLFGINPQQAEKYLKDTFNIYQLRVSGLFTQNNYFIFKKHTCIIPYIENNKFVFMKARNKTGAKQKYIGLAGVSAKRFYNIDILKATNEILIVEGEFDCMKSIQDTDNPTIAVGGVGLIPDLNILKNKEVFILLDNDNPGIEASKKLFDKLKQMNITTHLLKITSTAKDISELTK